MKYFLPLFVLLACASIFISGFNSSVFAENKDWRPEFDDYLSRNEIHSGVAYAIENEADTCEVLKRGTRQGVNPYLILLSILKEGGEDPLNKLCSCIDTLNISSAILASAGVDAGIDRESLARVSCIAGEGLAYTPADNPPADISIEGQSESVSPSEP